MSMCRRCLGRVCRGAVGSDGLQQAGALERAGEARRTVALQKRARSPRMRSVLTHGKSSSWCASFAVAVAAVCVWGGSFLINKPVLIHSPGEWDCACGAMYIKTTFRSLWNPLRERQPERIADTFLSKLRANECVAGPELCRAALPNGRVAEWWLAYREDAGSSATLFYKLTKYGERSKTRLTGVGAVELRNGPNGWCVTGYDFYF